MGIYKAACSVKTYERKRTRFFRSHGAEMVLFLLLILLFEGLDDAEMFVE